jgi:D-amino-acid oxidase
MSQKPAYIFKVVFSSPESKNPKINLLSYTDVLSYNRSKDPPAYSGPLKSEMHLSSPWFKDTVPNFRILDNRDLPLGYDSGTAWTSVCLNLAIYLPWLISQCLKNGVVLKRAVLNHISEAAKLHTYGKADVIVNCTGILASKLGGVMDTHVVPARGVTVVVRNSPGGDMFTTSGTDDGDDQPCYIMERAAGGGTILGGTYQKGNWESQSTQEQAIKIMKRCVDICPALTGGKGIEALSVIRVGIGLRPLRLSGVRIEREKIGDDWVVHNYGHAGWGYQASYGCSETVRELVDSVLIPKARL